MSVYCESVIGWRSERQVPALENYSPTNKTEDEKMSMER